MLVSTGDLSNGGNVLVNTLFCFLFFSFSRNSIGTLIPMVFSSYPDGQGHGFHTSKFMINFVNRTIKRWILYASTGTVQTRRALESLQEKQWQGSKFTMGCTPRGQWSYHSNWTRDRAVWQSCVFRFKEIFEFFFIWFKFESHIINILKFWRISKSTYLEEKLMKKLLSVFAQI